MYNQTRVKIFTTHSVTYDVTKYEHHVQGQWWYPNGPSKDRKENARMRRNNIGHDVKWMLDQRVAMHQQMVFDKFNLKIERFTPSPWPHHGHAVDMYINELGENWDCVVLFDIDCIPLNRDITPEVVDRVMSTDVIVGNAQYPLHKACQMNKIDPSYNVTTYAGPMFIAFSRKTYNLLGKPSFTQTSKYDIGGGVTAAAVERDIPVELLLPIYYDGAPVKPEQLQPVEWYNGCSRTKKHWKLPIRIDPSKLTGKDWYRQGKFHKLITNQPIDLEKTYVYSTGTIYGHNDIYHAFEIKRLNAHKECGQTDNTDKFIDMCRQTLDSI